mmetsp:Transcript_29912/g.49461  ORF Transcript_29912/g.49461 Transcript_29912/m.49461 type:complete len:297 (+) Transcript_29912:54-944(+)
MSDSMDVETAEAPKPPTHESPGMELDEYLQDASRWKTFDDVEDEVHYLRHRGDVLARGLKASREELAQLHEAGHRLQQAYEELHRQYREVAADAVYWQSLAEGSRAAESPAMPKPQGPHGPGHGTWSPEPTPRPEVLESPSDAREALRRAAVEAAKVLQQKQGKAEGKENVATYLSPSKTKGRDVDARTPNRRTCAEESPSPCPSTHSMPAMLFSNSKSIRKWGIGSSPRRCPKMGTPTRRAQVEGDFLPSPSRVMVGSRTTSPIRRRTGFGVPESLAARVPRLPQRSQGWGSPLR